MVGVKCFSCFVQKYIETLEAEDDDTQVEGGTENCMEGLQGDQGDVQVQGGAEKPYATVRKRCRCKTTIETRLEVEHNFSWREFQTKEN